MSRAETGLPAVVGEERDAPFAQLVTLCRSQFKATRVMPAAARRLLTVHFQKTFAWSRLQGLLPLQPLVPPGVPLPAARHYRSAYAWLPSEAGEAEALPGWDDFDLILRLFDFSPWRPILAQRFQSQKGPPAFDPVSLALGILLARWRGWSWPT